MHNENSVEVATPANLHPMDDVFRPAGEWQGLPPVAVTSHRITSVVTNVILWTAITIGLWLAFPQQGWPALLAAVAGVCWTTWRVIRIGRWVRAFRFREGERDLLISKGLWFRSLTAIPYGRMLSIEVTTGPINRLWGLSGVQLVTASAESHGTIPALTAEDAIRIRDQLIALGEEQALPL